MNSFDLDAAPEPAPSDEREERVHRRTDVEIEFDDGRRCSAVVTNLSTHGMGAEMQGSLQPFSLISVIKQGYGRVQGEVRWVDQDRFGVLFAEPVNVELFNGSDCHPQGPLGEQPQNGQSAPGFDIHSATGPQISF
ncbi:MAG: PilZ domain-containing protein [Parasphingorhabdus sp.]|uniref:PilZ domain-containing protein n=1 Tax=Parasphingorhabdus sp. TaxID=2709688 RepID=UPI0032671301